MGAPSARAISVADAEGRTESFEAARADVSGGTRRSAAVAQRHSSEGNSGRSQRVQFDPSLPSLLPGGRPGLYTFGTVGCHECHQERVGASFDAIRSELEIANVARVQGWDHGGFGAYVHRFVQNEMAAVDGTQDGQHHFFYVWHPDSDWYPAFEGRQAEDPLGPAFGGYHHDLATICLRMRADREALIETTDYGRAAVFHLVIPAYYPLVMDHPIAFADELLPLVITGGRHRGADLVWFAIRRDPREERLHLNFVGLLPQNQGNLAMTGGFVGFVGSWFGAAGCGLASAAFPPCAPVAAIVAESLVASLVASWTAMASGIVYDELTRESIQILGDPIFLE